MPMNFAVGLQEKEFRSNWVRYGVALAAFGLILGAALTLRYLDYKLDLTIPLIAGLIAAAWYGGRGPSIVYIVLLLIATVALTPVPPESTLLGRGARYLTAAVLMGFIAFLIAGRRESRANNDRLRRQNELLLHSVGEGIIGVDTRGLCTFANPAAAAMVGRQVSELIGQPLRSIIHHTRPDGTPNPDEEFPLESFFGGKESVHVKDDVFWRSDGTSFHVEYTSTLVVQDTKAVGAVTVFRDVSAQRKAEFEVRRQALLIEQSDEAIFVWDLEAGIIEWNSGSERLYGYTKEEALGKKSFQLLKTEFAAGAHEFFEILKREGSWTGELRQQTKSGREIISSSRYQVIELDGRRIVLQTNKDVTQQKKVVAALRDSELRYRYLFEHSPVPMWVYDKETLQFLAVNEAATKHYGYSRSEFLNLTIADIRPERDIPALKASVNGTKEPLQTSDNWTHRKKDGTEINVEITSHELEFGGRAARLVLANDITERKKAERALQRLNETLEQRVALRTADLEASNKELESFSYSVSHDLRAPLRAIDGFARIFAEDYSDSLDDEGKRLLSVIRTNARNMGQLIDDLLAFSRLGRKPIEAKPINMNEIVDSAEHEISTLHGTDGIEFRVDKLPTAYGDRALLRQVMVNLLSNAVKYSKKKDAVQVEVGTVDDPAENIYFVKDNGVGFDMAYSNKLFGVFQRLHGADEFEGTGVGLAIVQRVVNRHGGRVWADAEVDRGATFYFSLPKNGHSEAEVA